MLRQTDYSLYTKKEERKENIDRFSWSLFVVFSGENFFEASKSRLPAKSIGRWIIEPFVKTIENVNGIRNVFSREIGTQEISQAYRMHSQFGPIDIGSRGSIIG